MTGVVRSNIPVGWMFREGLSGMGCLSVSGTRCDGNAISLEESQGKKVLSDVLDSFVL